MHNDSHSHLWPDWDLIQLPLICRVTILPLSHTISANLSGELSSWSFLKTRTVYRFENWHIRQNDGNTITISNLLTIMLEKSFSFTIWLVFRKKDLYLIITQKLTFMKSGGFQVKSGGFHGWNPLDFRREVRRISKDQLPGMVSPMF